MFNTAKQRPSTSFHAPRESKAVSGKNVQNDDSINPTPKIDADELSVQALTPAAGNFCNFF
jgi:hypothetical protein